MKLAAPWWLFGTALAVIVGAFLIAGGLLLVRAVKRFGEEERVDALVTDKAGGRRAFKGALMVLSVAVSFVALAGPQYGRGTRLIPATNLDVVIVLDYSKSMYARDIAPSRIDRAKSEVARLIQDLPGARFGAVAFAGEPIAFPLTSDGAAIGQFFRQLSPNDMPVGGTAIGRALEAARELLARDPISKKHRRVIVLVTDGEDLEGDPVGVARAAANDSIAVNVVQIGGRTPEAIPEVDESGDVLGFRTDDDGKPLTTQLTAAGEAQLAKIAEVSQGYVVRSDRGNTGVREVTARMRKLMTEELSEKVETVYADVYAYPLGLALLLLILESFVGESRRRKPAPPLPPPPPRRRGIREKKRSALTATAVGMLLSVWVSGVACESVDRVFTRNSPTVDDAIEALDAGDASVAFSLLSEYLGSGACEQGNIGTPEEIKKKSNAGFDLGLALFTIGESFGRRFGDEEPEGPDTMGPEEQATLASRNAEVECALRIVRAIAGDSKQPIELRARADYLAGNLEFLRKDYRAAVKSYDRSLTLIPGLSGDASDGIGRDAAWNRAIALRRIEEEEQNQDAGQDAQPDSQPDAPPDGPPDGGDGGDDSRPDGGDSGDSGGGGDSGGDAGSDGGQSEPDPKPEEQEQEPEAKQPEPNVNQDERMLDRLERAPTLQQEAAKNRALRGSPVRGMEDK